MRHKVYLQHMDEPYEHAQHYLGFTTDLKAREDRHENGNGSPLLLAVEGAGIAFGVVRTWDCHCSLGRSGHWCETEKVLKKRKNNRQLCPICAVEVRRRKALQMKLQREAMKVRISTDGKEKEIKVEPMPEEVERAIDELFPEVARDPAVRKHQERIARDTLKMPDAIAGVMGGPTKDEARRVLKRLKGVPA